MKAEATKSLRLWGSQALRRPHQVMESSRTFLALRLHRHTVRARPPWEQSAFLRQGQPTVEPRDAEYHLYGATNSLRFLFRKTRRFPPRRIFSDSLWWDDFWISRFFLLLCVCPVVLERLQRLRETETATTYVLLLSLITLEVHRERIPKKNV